MSLALTPGKMPLGDSSRARQTPAMESSCAAPGSTTSKPTARNRKGATRFIRLLQLSARLNSLSIILELEPPVLLVAGMPCCGLRSIGAGSDNDYSDPYKIGPSPR